MMSRLKALAPVGRIYFITSQEDMFDLDCFSQLFVTNEFLINL
jgi:hypothetical protein